MPDVHAADCVCAQCERARLDAAFYGQHPELKALRDILETLAPLSRDSQARVLLHCILAYTPKAFSDQELLALVRAARARAAA
jgi:hypothetical protein